MPIRKIPNSDQNYFLIVFDEKGVERREPDGSLLSDQVLARLSAGVSDVFVMSHGWKGDVPAAIEQYDNWIGSMLEREGDIAEARVRSAAFAPLFIGIHWPSMPWGDESFEAPRRGGLLSVDGTEELDAYASRIADSGRARRAIEIILTGAGAAAPSGKLPTELRQAYLDLYSESGLGHDGESGSPGNDQDGFDPDVIIADAQLIEETLSGDGQPGLLGGGQRVREFFLTPLRQLSFWKMKDRARSFGESGAHALIIAMQGLAPRARIHLMGHSFGCIVVSAAVAGKKSVVQLLRPVESMYLVQGALSLWAYSGDIPYAPGKAGYFNRIIANRLVNGPIVTTRSTHDTAVRRFYPLGAGLARQLVLNSDYPRYGGVGMHGIQGVDGAQQMTMQADGFVYRFEPGGIYNLEASDIIRIGEGASGAHNDIVHEEVAHTFWSAAMSSFPRERIVRSINPSFGDGAEGVSGGSGGLLGGGSVSAPASMPHPAAARPSAEQPDAPRADPGSDRWILAQFEDHPSGAPLLTSRWYTLAFDVDIARRLEAAASAPLDTRTLFQDDVKEVQLKIQLNSDDFEVDDAVRTLRIPRTGRSLNKARFDVSPRHDGPSTLTATIHKDNNFIQEMRITIQVGETARGEVSLLTRGRPPLAAAVLKPRDVGLTISPGVGGYDCVAWGPVATRFKLPLLPAQLAAEVDVARKAIMKVIMFRTPQGQFPFQSAVNISPEDSKFALETMARAGALLFQKIFFGPAAGADLQRVGNYFREMATSKDRTMKLQVLAETAPIPWGMLYVGDASSGATLDWQYFLGVRHIIECIPLQTSLSVMDNAISSSPRLSVSVNFNDTIDAQMNANFVATQKTFWNGQSSNAAMNITSRSLKKDLMQALASGATEDQILYFYCHAKSAGLNSPGGPGAALIELSDASITLDELTLDAPTSIRLLGKPLVFLNACESADLSPAFYDGFVPYFMAKGARGVIGTECQTPAVFALEWSQRFFKRFLGGQPLGEAFSQLRGELLEQHRNPLGLMYAVYCDGDTQVHPAVP